MNNSKIIWKESAEQSLVDSPNKVLKKKPIAPIACENCRRSKVKCSGTHPCVTCLKRKVICFYTSSKRLQKNSKDKNQKSSNEDSQTVAFTTHEEINISYLVQQYIHYFWFFFLQHIGSSIHGQKYRATVTKNPFIDYLTKDDSIAFPLIKYSCISITARSFGDYVLSEEFHKKSLEYSKTIYDSVESDDRIQIATGFVLLAFASTCKSFRSAAHYASIARSFLDISYEEEQSDIERVTNFVIGLISGHMSSVFRKDKDQTTPKIVSILLNEEDLTECLVKLKACFEINLPKNNKLSHMSSEYSSIWRIIEFYDRTMLTRKVIFYLLPELAPFAIQNEITEDLPFAKFGSIPHIIGERLIFITYLNESSTPNTYLKTQSVHVFRSLIYYGMGLASDSLAEAHEAFKHISSFKEMVVGASVMVVPLVYSLGLLCLELGDIEGPKIAITFLSKYAHGFPIAKTTRDILSKKVSMLQSIFGQTTQETKGFH